MIKLQEDIVWVGSIDWSLRNFHGYSTPLGSTYNAYLILDEKPTLIDSVKTDGFDELVRRIHETLPLSEIRYIISNHTEMDHSGSIANLLKWCPDAEIVCSPKGEEGLKKHFQNNWKFKVVDSGDTLNIGKRNLSFLLMPMVHWPDSMATYSIHDEALFSNDAFGQHRASVERYADELGLDMVLEDAAKYYGNIVLPYGNQVLKVLAAVRDLKIKTIYPSHGLIWRGNDSISKIIGRYEKWASHQTDNKVLIVYDTMWSSTKIIADKLFSLIDEAGIPVKKTSLQHTHISDVVTDILTSKMVFFGTPILNNRMLPSMASLVMYLKGLKPKNRFAFTFGSYGWAPSAFKELEQSIQEAGFELFQDGIYIQYVPDEKELEKLSDLLPILREKMSSHA
ncbi:MAG: FprA family A-type flavoprotein [Candidatus Aureabacteria bacterium]|nr:FprA family A-type flavoprotein [Candidatus Auribacterota bacterium]